MELKTLEGTWEEVKSHDRELEGHIVRLEVLDSDTEPDGSPASLVFREASGQDILRHAGGWSGDDLEECLQAVYDNRTKARFD